MSGKTGISWTDRTWVPLTGCTRVSPACDACYAFTLHDQRHVAWKRGRLPNAAAQYREPFSTVQLLPARLEEPLHWRQSSKVFLTSMGDVFHETVPDDYVDHLFAVMSRARWHTFQLLTKRPERMAAYCQAAGRDQAIMAAATGQIAAALLTSRHVIPGAVHRLPLPNVWLGTTAEDQRRADERLPLLLATPGVVRWASVEPLLGPVDLGSYLRCCPSCGGPRRDRYADACGYCENVPEQQGLAWVVVGGESGPRYRELDLHWLEDLMTQCRDAGVPVWVKQDSDRLPGKQGRIPDELWLHEFPRQAVPA